MSDSWITIEKAVSKYHVSVEQILDLESQGEIERGPDVGRKSGIIYQYSEDQIATRFSLRDRKPSNIELWKASLVGGVIGAAISKIGSIADYEEIGDSGELKDNNEAAEKFDLFDGQKNIELIKAKWEYVNALIDEWGLDERERGVLFGISPEGLKIIKTMGDYMYGLDLELRCDLIYRLKVVLTMVYGDSEIEAQRLWFRTPVPTHGDLTPIQLIFEGGFAAFKDLITGMNAIES